MSTDRDASPPPVDRAEAGNTTPVAWLHTLHMEHGQTSQRLTFADGNPWGTPGVDYSAEYAVTSQPLHAAQPLEGLTAATASQEQVDRALLLAEVELHLQSCRIFLTSREKMHPCGVDLHDELQAKVSVALAAINQEKRHG